MFCIVTCQADVIKHMLQNLILSGRIGKWAYAELLFMDEPVRPDTSTGLTTQTSLTGQETGLTGQPAENSESVGSSNFKGKAEVADWRVPIVTYLKDPGHGAVRNIRRLVFKTF